MCCPLAKGSISIADYTELTPSFEATWTGAIAYDCPITAPNPDMPPPIYDGKNTQQNEIMLPVTMNIEGTEGSAINKYTGTTMLAGQPFEVIVSSGALSWTNTGGDQPIICDGTSELGLTSAMTGDIGYESALSTGVMGAGNLMYAALGIVLLLAAGGAYMKYKGKMAKDPPPTSAAGGMYPAAGGTGGYPTAGGYPAAGGGAPPMMPQQQSSFLPAGWTEMRDPNSGATYYYNQQTGESSWTRPGYV